MEFHEHHVKPPWGVAPYLSHVNLCLKLPGYGPGGGENGRPVAIGIGIDHINGLWREHPPSTDQY